MFNLEKQITEWRAEMSRAGIRNPEVLDELEAHLREHMERLPSDQRNDAAFQAAVGQLGNTKSLKAEFAKVHHLLSFRDNPAALNVLGLCFVLFGLQSLANFVGLSFAPAHDHVEHIGKLIVLGFLFFFSLQLFAGIGLIWRRNFFRRCVFFFAVLNAFICCVDFASSFYNAQDYFTGHYYLFQIIPLPAGFERVIDLLVVGTIVWGCIYLSRQTVRHLFNSRTKTATA